MTINVAAGKVLLVCLELAKWCPTLRRDPVESLCWSDAEGMASREDSGLKLKSQGSSICIYCADCILYTELEKRKCVWPIQGQASPSGGQCPWPTPRSRCWRPHVVGFNFQDNILNNCILLLKIVMAKYLKVFMLRWVKWYQTTCLCRFLKYY